MLSVGDGNLPHRITRLIKSQEPPPRKHGGAENALRIYAAGIQTLVAGEVVRGGCTVMRDAGFVVESSIM